jgi:hypothetical protein
MRLRADEIEYRREIATYFVVFESPNHDANLRKIIISSASWSNAKRLRSGDKSNLIGERSTPVLMVVGCR